MQGTDFTLFYAILVTYAGKLHSMLILTTGYHLMIETYRGDIEAFIHHT